MYKKQVRLFKHGAIIYFRGLHEVTGLMAMKMRLKMKNRSHRFDIN